jgi:hypothetical protein
VMERIARRERERSSREAARPNYSYILATFAP